jgi:hypothetical protein
MVDTMASEAGQLDDLMLKPYMYDLTPLDYLPPSYPSPASPLSLFRGASPASVICPKEDIFRGASPASVICPKEEIFRGASPASTCPKEDILSSAFNMTLLGTDLQQPLLSEEGVPLGPEFASPVVEDLVVGQPMALLDEQQQEQQMLAGITVCDGGQAYGAYYSEYEDFNYQESILIFPCCIQRNFRSCRLHRGVATPRYAAQRGVCTKNNFIIAH